MVGGIVSGTVTMKVQLEERRALSMAVQVTVVFADPANCDPDGGLQLTALIPELSLAVAVNPTVAYEAPRSGV